MENISESNWLHTFNKIIRFNTLFYNSSCAEGMLSSQFHKSFKPEFHSLPCMVFGDIVVVLFFKF